MAVLFVVSALGFVFDYTDGRRAADVDNSAGYFCASDKRHADGGIEAVVG